jgi:signal transduction histidine kinase
VRVTIEDNGQGFDIDKAMAASSGRGLQNQRRRARSINGIVSWEPLPRGTRFVLWLPLRRQAQAA